MATQDNKTLQNLVTRVHPDYKELGEHWAFLESTYEGGRAWFSENIFKYHKEGDSEFEDRVKRAYRFNHTREIVDLVNKYLWRSEIERSSTVPSYIADFWKSATLEGLGIQEYMQIVSRNASIFGVVWVVVDNSQPSTAISIADQKQAGGKIYSYFVKPQFVKDFAFGEDGKISWVLIEESFRDDSDPFSSTGTVSSRWRLWTRTHAYLIERVNATTGGSKPQEVVYKIVNETNHDLGEVPVFPAFHLMGAERHIAPSMISDIAYLDRACANYLSNLDAIIQDQTFSQLAMPAQGVIPGDDTYTKLVEVGTKRIFLFDAEGGIAPFYLSPDVKQAELIITAIKQIINEIYHSVGVAGERTKQDNSMGIDNSSGVAKAYDFERVNALLVSKGKAMQYVENEICRLIKLWNSEDASEREELVTYTDNYDIRGLNDELDLSTRLEMIQTPMIMRQEQLKRLVAKMWPQLDEAKKKEIESAIAEMEDMTEMAFQAAELKFGTSQQGAKGQTKKGKGQTSSE